MRVYLPALSSDLTAERPPAVPGFAAEPPPQARPDDIEMLEDDAQTQAALASLERLRDAPRTERATRLVLAADAPAVRGEPVGGADGGLILRVPAPRLTWADVVALLVDEGGAAGAVRSVLEAGDQDDADRAVAALWEHPLVWFDASEREALAAAWRAENRAV